MSRLRPFDITVFDVPTHRRGGFDSFEKTLGGVNATRNREQKPIDGRIDDTDGIMTDDLGIVFRVHPRAACELNETRRVQQHTPEVRDRRTSAWGVADRIAEYPEAC